MRLDVRADVLADALSMAALALDPKIQAEVANAVHIKAAEGGVRLVTNTGGRIIAATAPANTAEPGEGAVRAAALAGLAANLPADAAVSIETIGPVVTIASGSARYRLATVPTADLPTMPVIDMELGRVELDREMAVRAFTVPLFACDTGARPYLSGVYLTTNADNNTLAVVGTDGRRLARLSVPATGALSSDRRLIVPLASVKIINKLLARSKGGTILLRRSRSLLELTAPNFVFTTGLIDGTFPFYERVIPEPSGNTATADRRALALAMKRLKAAAHPQCGLPAATLEWQRGGADLQLELHRQPNAADDRVAAETTGAACVAEGLGLLAQIADEFTSASIKLDCAGNVAAIRITDPADPDLLVLLMPLAP